MPSLAEAAGLALTCAPAIYYFARISEADFRAQILYSCGVAALAFVTTYVTVPRVSEYFSRKGLKGRDMGRRGTKDEAREIPSALGLVCGAIYIAFIILSQIWRASGQPLADYNAALLSICFMVLLGFADDVLDLPWRYKLLLPTIASLPLLANYHAYHGLTTVVVPSPLRPLLAAADGSGLTWIGRLVEAVGLADVHAASGGRIVDLGLVYLVYMGLLAVFATNAINIYAGVNGLEAGQAVIIGIAILTANLFELASGAEGEHAYHHLLSAGLGLPFIATTAGLLAHNVFPAKVFVGDTFCYFAGMTFAVMGILGHFSKTLLLFLLPQIVNFVYSLPQLFKVYPCPRHRLPEYDAALDVMRPSTFEVPALAGGGGGGGGAAAANGSTAGAAAAGASGAKKRRGSVAPAAPAAASAASAAAGNGAEGSAAKATVRRDNMTLINLALRVLGPMSERRLTNTLLVVQVLSCALGLGVRYWVSDFLFETKHDAASLPGAGRA